MAHHRKKGSSKKKTKSCVRKSAKRVAGSALSQQRYKHRNKNDDRPRPPRAKRK